MAELLSYSTKLDTNTESTLKSYSEICKDSFDVLKNDF